MSSSTPSSPAHQLLALPPTDPEWQPVLHVSNQVVLYHPTSHALVIKPSNNLPERLRRPCPYCKQTLPPDYEPDLDVDDIAFQDSDPAYHSRASDYFRLLEVANEASSRPVSPLPEAHDSERSFQAEKMAEGYFKAFFKEEYKLGMGANGSVFLCQVRFIITSIHLAAFTLFPAARSGRELFRFVSVVIISPRL